MQPGIYRGIIDHVYNATGAQISRRYFLVLSADQLDEEAIDITDHYEGNVELE